MSPAIDAAIIHLFINLEIQLMKIISSTCPVRIDYHGPRRALSVTVPLVLLALSTAASDASTIVFDNIAATPQYYNNFGDWTGNFLPNMYAISAMNFTPSATGALDELDLGYTD